MTEERKDIGKALAESLKRLILTTPFERITIKQITDGAGVIRVTFYNHYQDKYDLLSHIIRTEILEPVGILLKNDMYKEALTLIFTNLKRTVHFTKKQSGSKDRIHLRRSRRSVSTSSFWIFSVKGAAAGRMPDIRG